jgi:signal transduction histidine kinase
MMPESVRVLLIEDNTGHAELLRRGLARSGLLHSLYVAENLADGLAELEASTFDVVLADLSLPDSSGTATVQAICERAPTVPVVVMTALDNEATAAAALDCGAQDYIVKESVNLNWTSLRQAIHHALQRQLVLNEKRALLSQLQDAMGELARKNRRLARLYKMGQSFVDQVSHEFRTPLSIIKEYAALMRDGVVGTVSQDQWRLLNVIDDRTDDLNTMVDDMLDVSKFKSGLLCAWRRPCTVPEIIQHVLPALERKAATRGVMLETQIEPDLPTVYCDPEKAGRVVVNLVVNGIKFSGDPGRVSLWVRADREAHEVVAGVTDNGPGIAEDDLERLFRRFSQLENSARTSTKGFGLGLNIAKELTLLNLGKMSVESEQGHGSTFRFTIPFAEPSEVVGRYLDRMVERQHGDAPISIVLASVADGFEDPLARDLDRFLNFLLRRHDLLFRVDATRWLLVLCAPAIALGNFISRVQQRRHEANRNRPYLPLPEIMLQADGTWPAEAGRTQIIERVEHWREPAGADAGGSRGPAGARLARSRVATV